MITIHIELGKKCVRCHKGGATQGGLCMRCITKALEAGEYDSILNKARNECRKPK